MSGTIYGTPKITTTLTSFDIATANKPEYALRVSDSGTEINGTANISGVLTVGSPNTTGPLQARYIRFQRMINMNTINFAEIQVFGLDGIELNKSTWTVTISAAHSVPSPPSNFIDNNFSSFAIAIAVAGSIDGAWIEVDMGELKTFSNFKLFNRIYSGVPDDRAIGITVILKDNAGVEIDTPFLVEDIGVYGIVSGSTRRVITSGNATYTFRNTALNVYGTANISGALSAGSANLSDSLTVNSNASISGALTAGSANITGLLTANGLTTTNYVNSSSNTVRLKPSFNTKDSWFQFQNSTTTTDSGNNIFDFAIEDTFNRISTRVNRDLVLRSGTGSVNIESSANITGGSLEITKPQTPVANDNPYIRLMPQGTAVNNTGLTNIFMSTSSSANYGISLNAWRFQTSGEPKFVIKTHNASSAGVDRFTIDNNGNVGIGTTNPTAKLHVIGTANISGDLSVNRIITPNVSTNSVTIGGINAPIMGGNWVTANMSGTYNNLIGPNHPRPEGGFIMANQSSGGDLPWGYYMGTHKDNSFAGPASLRLDFGAVTTLPTAQFPSANPSFLSYMTIRTGRVGINQNNPGQALHVMGNGFFSGSVIQGSDARLKENIGPLDEVETHIKVLQLQPKSYQLIDRGNDDRIDIGLIAQEVKPIFPELVFEDDEGMMALCYDKVSILMLQSIKQLQKQIDELKNEIIQLKKIKMCNNIA